MEESLPERSKNYLRDRLLPVVIVATLLLLLVAGAGLAYNYFREETAPPQNVRVTNMSEGGATVSWTTEKPTFGFVYYSENPGKLSPGIFAFRRANVASDLHGLSSTVHYAEIRNLSPETTYHYLISSGLRTYKVEVSGSAFPELTTLRALETAPRVPQPAYGQVRLSDGFNPAFPVVVTVSREGALPLSAMTNLEGNWTLDLGGFRTESGEYAQFGEGPIYVINAQGGQLGTASGILSSLEAQPAGELILE